MYLLVSEKTTLHFRFFFLLFISSISFSANDCNARVLSVNFVGAENFVSTSNNMLILKSKPFFCAGTNAFYAALVDIFTETQVKQFFHVHAARGASVVRIFAHSDGTASASHPIQPSLGKYDETALKRLDLVLAEANSSGIKLILPLTNYEPFLGGIQFYSNQVFGLGADKELFFTDATIKNAYKSYVKMFILRRNTITGVQYRDDPTIMAFELMNEPHTRDNYEKNHCLGPAGSMVRAWIHEMAAYIKSIDENHLLFTGEEGYRAGKGNQQLGLHSWINNGLKGVDFDANCADENIDACTVHSYPDNWGYCSTEYDLYGPQFIQDRAAVAHSLSKPIIMEEYGMKTGYLSSRNTLLRYLQNQANAAQYACTLVWSVDALGVDSGAYVFQYDGDGWDALREQYQYMRNKTMAVDG